jgi:hypothetical protein
LTSGDPDGPDGGAGTTIGGDDNGEALRFPSGAVNGY